MSFWFPWISHYRSKNQLQELLDNDGETTQIESSYTGKNETLDNPLIKPITEQPTNPTTTTTYSPPSNELTEKEKKEKKTEKEKEESPFSPFFKFWGHT